MCIRDRDYATRSGEALDWMLAELDPDYVAKYAHAVNYKGNKHFQNPVSYTHLFSAESAVYLV